VKKGQHMDAGKIRELIGQELFDVAE